MLSTLGVLPFRRIEGNMIIEVFRGPKLCWPSDLRLLLLETYRAYEIVSSSGILIRPTMSLQG